MNKYLSICATLIAMSIQPLAAEESPVNVSFGVSLQPTTWEGENKGGSNTDYDETTTQIHLNLRIRKGKFYSGLSFQGGEYDFEGGAPDRVVEAGAFPKADATIERTESDLVFGYFFWPQVSLFLDIKRIHNDWKDDSYSVTYKGTGLGVSGFNPINEDWVFFGSLGIIKLDAETDDDTIGDGKGSALVVGALYKINEQSTFSISLKTQHNEIDFDDGSEQENDTGGLVFGFNYSL